MYACSNPRLKYKPRSGIYSNSSGTNKFDPKTLNAYSYSWWLYLTKIKGKVVYNAYNYSNSTSGHQSALRGLLKDLKIKIDATVHVADGLQNFENKALIPVYREIFELEVKSARRGAREKTKKWTASKIKMLQADVKLYRSLGAKLSRKAQAALKAEVVQAEAERLERARAERKDKPVRSTARLVKESGIFEIVM